ncbi:putative iron-regulated membrane protein [Neorhizobium sp. 2083]|uniref:PepSY domain-containing protein n=1 Tax=Neorhizobium sp. 2083 TaxID=2817762 RepID=UPI0028575B73|nr:PepSY domain-containing protein [Neorhizobium sp. 2083]MDR6820931.1 putative iron-regulated membrane protein [Neorhizobium sp. 2083]
MPSITIADTADTAVTSVSLYRAIWRWHFFAGLLVIPFLLNLAVTGSLYLFKDEINDTVFGYRYLVAPDGRALSPQKLVDVAVAAVPGSTPTSYKDPASPERSAIVTVSHDKVATQVFLNPYDGKVLDTVASDEEFNYVVKRIHSLALFGDVTNKLIEIAAGFAMVLVVTGIYLWWPRQQTGGVVTVRGTPARRVFWRDLHAVTGAFAGILIFFLALTGMPWSSYWGTNVNSWLGSHGLGYPTQLWDDVPKSQKVTSDILPKVGWTVEKAPVPLSDIAAARSKKPVGLDVAIEVARAAGIRPGFDIAIPADASMPMLYDLIKSVHIVAMVVWFGGTMSAVLALAYANPEIIAKFARFDRLVTTPALVLLWLAGITMAVWYGWFNSGWLVTKLVFVVALSGFHGMVSGRLRRAQAILPDQPTAISRAIPAIIVGLTIIVTLAVTKMF